MSSMNESTGTNRKRTRFATWEHFKRTNDNQDKAECIYCGALIGCSSSHGTSGMHNHLGRCKEYPYANVEKKQKSSSGQIVGVSSSSSSGPWKLDQDAGRKDLAAMFIIGELPFKFVENEGFRRFVSRIQPKFLIPSRNTLRQDCYKLYLEERGKLKKYFFDTSPRVCLTTDTWTSCQNLSYMCLTAHFVDADWKLQKKILNFCQISGHSGEIIGKAVERCLTSWGIKSIFSITVDNASSNDLGVQYLKKRLNYWNSLVLAGELLHVRCCAHILSLIVREGLKDIDDSIIRIRSAVRYVRSSPSRMQRFKKCIEVENIESNSLVCLDVETRWNSTYMMLEAALKFQKAFISLEIGDSKFVEELSKMKGLPTSDDWEYARLFLPFLKLFYDTTLKVSGSSYVTSNDMAKNVFGVYMMRCDVDGPTPFDAQVVFEMPQRLLEPSGLVQLYLVQSSTGSLLFVSQWGDYLYLSMSRQRPTKSYRFHVFEIDLDTQTCTEAMSLENTSLFLGHNSAFSLEVDENNIIKSNCMYFTEDFLAPSQLTKDGGVTNMGIYHLEDGMIEPHVKGKSSVVLWIKPSF